jgi:hypothetical protein
MCRATGIIAMRLGPGKHLKGKTLMNGVISPEEFNYFHEVCFFRSLILMIWQYMRSTCS